MDHNGKHVDLDKCCPENFNIGLTDRQLGTIRIKKLNKMLKDLTKEQVKLLREKRRRIKNREYAQKLVNKKKNEFEELKLELKDLEVEHGEF